MYSLFKPRRTHNFIILALMAFIFTLIPAGAAYSDTSSSPFIMNAYFDSGELLNGQKGVDTAALTFIKLHYNSSYVLKSALELEHIKVFENYAENVNYKFSWQSTTGSISLRLKSQPSGAAYKLKEHSVYDIILPRDIFTPALAEDAHFTFVTAGSTGTYQNDILIATEPKNDSEFLDNNISKITFRFVGDISMEKTVSDNISNYIEVSSDCLAAGISGYKENDNISNYNVSILNNMLIISPKTGEINDFANYTVRLKKDTVYLTKPFMNSGIKIYNESKDGSEWETISFTTGNMLESSDPQEQQKEVKINPTISLTFKYPIKIVNPTTFAAQISLQSADDNTGSIADRFVLNPQIEGKKLILQLEPRQQHFSLQRGTDYTLTIPKGEISFQNYAAIKQEIKLHFTTSSKGNPPVPLKYSSDINGSDELRELATSQLNDRDSIYVIFDTPLRWSQTAEKLLTRDRVKLYSLPHFEETGYDSTAQEYGKQVTFKQCQPPLPDIIVPEGIAIDKPEDCYQMEDYHYMNLVPLSSVEICAGNPKVLKITPFKPLEGMQKYQLQIGKNMLEDGWGYKLDRDIITGLWAKASTTAPVASWIEPLEIGEGEIIDKSEGKNKNYLVNNAPLYNQDKPIKLSLKGDVLWKAQEQTIGTNITKIISYNSFKTISLKPTHTPEETGENENGEDKKDKENGNEKQAASVTLNKFALEYYFIAGEKHTRISIYPDQELKPGTNYTLRIPGDAFTDRGGRSLGELTVQFITRGDSTTDAKAIKLKESNFNNKDFYDGNLNVFILGANFTPETQAIIELTPVAGKVLDTHTESITLEDIYFYSHDCLRLNINGEIARRFSTNEYAGTYDVHIRFKPDDPKYSLGQLTIASKGGPELISKSPDSSDKTYDQFSINPQNNVYGQTRYFIKLTFKDEDGTLGFMENEDTFLQKLKSCSVCAAGGSQASMIDQDLLDKISSLEDTEKKEAIEKYLLIKNSEQKRTYLNIPIKLLRSHTNYEVTIAQNLIAFLGSAEGNAELNWSFTTLAAPLVSGVSPRSVGEGYSSGEYILISGDHFSPQQGNIRVRFFSGSATDATEEYWADRAELVTNVDKTVVLKVYLPRGGERLPPGVYNITVLNGTQHKETLYEVLSVIPRADKPLPQEGIKVNTEARAGDIIAAVDHSTSTLELDSRYLNRSYVELDLDELMGTAVWERTITLKPHYRDRIGELRAQSAWVTASFYGVQASPSTYSNLSAIRLGRAAPMQARSLQNQLGRRGLHSDIIEVTVEGLKIDTIRLTIPFHNSDGQNLQVMYYDLFSRRWYPLPSQINWVDKTLTINGTRAGFFAVVNTEGRV